MTKITKMLWQRGGFQLTLLRLFLHSIDIEGILGDRPSGSDVDYIWSEPFSLAPLGLPVKEDLPVCDEGHTQDTCLHRADEPMGWQDAQSYCRGMNGFLVSRHHYEYLTLWWPKPWDKAGNNITWTALTNYKGQYQWLGRSPSRSDFVDWLETPKTWDTDCAAFNLTTAEFQLHECAQKLHFFCTLNQSESIIEASTIDISDVELKVSGSMHNHHGLIKVAQDNFDDLSLTCQAYSKTTGEKLKQQPHIFWRKDNVYIDHNVAGLQPSTVHDSSKSESVAPGISELINQQQLAQGTYWCESWIPNSEERLTSNKMLVTLEEWVTLIFRANRNESLENITVENVKQTLCNDFQKQFDNISSFTWNVISVEKEPIVNSTSSLAKYKFHVHMPRIYLNIERQKIINFTKKYNEIFKEAKFLDTSNLTFATFCYKQRESFNSGKSLIWPFKEAGYIYPTHHKCKVEYGKLGPGLCKGDYLNGAYLTFDPSPCTWSDLCPNGYTSMRNKFCVAISPPSDWETAFKAIFKTGQEISLLDNNLILDSSKSYGKIKNLTLTTTNQGKIWLPVKRGRHLGPLVYRGPKTPDHDYQKYNEFQDNNISWREKHPHSDQNCLAFDLEARELHTSDCKKELPFLAVIDRDFLDINLSPRKWSSLSIATPECTGKERDTCLCQPGWNTPIFKGEYETCFKLFTSPEKLTWLQAKTFCEKNDAQLPTPNVGFLDWVYRNFLTDNNITSVWMGMEWIPDRILYNGPEDNVNWLPETNYSRRYGTLLRHGWTLENEEVVKENILCQQIIHPTVSMELRVNEPKNKDSQTMCIDVNPEQMLMNENGESIVCFVNGAKLFPVLAEGSGCQYELELSIQGYYQCQAWTRPPFMLATSNTIIHRDFGTYTFVITLSQNKEYHPKEHDATFANEQSSRLNTKSCWELMRKYLESTELNHSFRFSNKLPFHTPDSNYTKILHNFHLESEIRGRPDMKETELLENLKEKLLIDNEISENGCSFERIRSTTGCLSDISFDDSSDFRRNLTWPETVGNIIVVSEELCITPNGEPVTRECLGDFIEGYYWGEPSHSCTGVPSKLTETLWEIQKNAANLTVGATLADLTSNQSSLQPADIHFIAKAFQGLSEMESSEFNFDDIVRVISNVMKANATAFELVQRKLNSSSALLGAFEELTFRVQLPSLQGDQTRKTSKDMISVERLDLEANSTVIGYKSQGKYEETLLVGFKNEDLADAEAAIILPSNLTYTVSSKTMRQSRNRNFQKETAKVPLAFAVFQNEKLFQDNVTHANYTINSRIIMAKYKGEMIKDLQEPVKILFKPFETGNDTKCVFWDFTLNNHRGGWSEEGCIKGESQGQHDVCLCNHLTNFAQLINYDENSGFDSTHAVILDVITTIGCSLSIIGLLLVFTTFFLFKKWRRSLSNKILVNLSFSVFCSMVIFLAGIDQTWNDQLCRSVAVGLHYFILASFGWMLVEAVHQYLKFVKVVGTYIPRFLWKASVCAWGIPVLPILFVLIYDHSLYDSKNDYNNDFRICWMSVEGFKYAFLPPLALTMTVNLVMYSLIIHGAICGRARVNSTMSERALFMNQLRMAVCVFFLLGFTWIFGLLAVCQLRQIFSYLFCIFNTLQGFFLFLFHVCREQGARKYWKDFLSVLTKDSTSTTPGNSFHQANSLQFRGHPDSVSFDRCGGILVFPQGPPIRPHLRRTNRQSLLSARTNSTLIQSRTSYNP